MGIFKYMSTEAARRFIRTLKVRFTQPSDLNDPFELHPFIDFNATAEEFRGEIDARIDEIFGTIDGVLAYIEKQQATDPKYPKIAAPIKVFRAMVAANPALGKQFMAEMARHKTELLGEIANATLWEKVWQQFQQVLGGLLGIFSLTENPAHPLMWSHYAEQHCGVVVQFDENHPWFNQKIAVTDDIRQLVKVAYVQNPHPRTWRQLNGPDVLYTKGAEWAYEREWRIIRPLKDGIEVSPGKFCFDVPPDAIRSITFGCRVDPAFEKEIRDVVAANPNLSHIRLNRIRLLGNGNLEVVEDA